MEHTLPATTLALIHSDISNLLISVCFSVRITSKDLTELSAEIKQPRLPELTGRFLYDKLHPNSPYDSGEDNVRAEDFPIIREKIYTYSSAAATFYAPSDPCGPGGMHREHIRATPSWFKGPPHFDNVFVEQGNNLSGMRGLVVARVLLFYSFKHRYKKYSCALVHWYKVVGEMPDSLTGYWVVKPEFVDNDRDWPNLQVIDLESILRAAHLMPVFPQEYLFPMMSHPTMRFSPTTHSTLINTSTITRSSCSLSRNGQRPIYLRSYCRFLLTSQSFSSVSKIFSDVFLYCKDRFRCCLQEPLSIPSSGKTVPSRHHLFISVLTLVPTSFDDCKVTLNARKGPLSNLDKGLHSILAEESPPMLLKMCCPGIASLDLCLLQLLTRIIFDAAWGVGWGKLMFSGMISTQCPAVDPLSAYQDSDPASDSLHTTIARILNGNISTIMESSEMPFRSSATKSLLSRERHGTSPFASLMRVILKLVERPAGAPRYGSKTGGRAQGLSEGATQAPTLIASDCKVPPPYLSAQSPDKPYPEITDVGKIAYLSHGDIHRRDERVSLNVLERTQAFQPERFRGVQKRVDESINGPGAG
ncbi:hypothetical protein CERSUDRAFT_78095 [Gelatoporia subvermispora B]|uniref:Uncharacterized protein n=1 Tax=Ceriporiopsis subvermispora (strain B) TaxID=914234 RepID=M2P811_CERS8|nr:hypothetical protein CERSUDRAFT_78095 [Gelatoporia subvermispora B]